MTQQRLNNVMLLNVHKDLTDVLELLREPRWVSVQNRLELDIAGFIHKVARNAVPPTKELLKFLAPTKNWKVLAPTIAEMFTRVIARSANNDMRQAMDVTYQWHRVRLRRELRAIVGRRSGEKCQPL